MLHLEKAKRLQIRVRKHALVALELMASRINQDNNHTIGIGLVNSNILPEQQQLKLSRFSSFACSKWSIQINCSVETQ